MRKSERIFIVIAVICICFFYVLSACVPDESNKNNNTEKNVETAKTYTVTANNGEKFEVIEIDGCEYVEKTNVSVTSHGYSVYTKELSHKGNCKYCKQRKNNNE